MTDAEKQTERPDPDICLQVSYENSADLPIVGYNLTQPPLPDGKELELLALDLKQSVTREEHFH